MNSAMFWVLVRLVLATVLLLVSIRTGGDIELGSLPKLAGCLGLFLLAFGVWAYLAKDAVVEVSLRSLCFTVPIFPVRHHFCAMLVFLGIVFLIAGILSFLQGVLSGSGVVLDLVIICFAIAWVIEMVAIYRFKARARTGQGP
jgi:hypothetical protein